MLTDESPAPRAFVRRFLGLATLIAVGLLLVVLVVLVSTGHVEWKLAHAGPI